MQKRAAIQSSPDLILDENTCKNLVSEYFFHKLSTASFI